MILLKSQSYTPSPNEYLQKFKNPHQIISTKGNFELDEKDQATINTILGKYYNDNQYFSTIKQRILTEITEIVSQWMKDIANSTKHPDFDFKKLGYGLKVFGSYHLKTNSYDGDIDMLIIVPQFFNRQQHFFGNLANYLRRHQNFKQIFPIPDAIVPLIRLTSYGVQIDLLLSIISQDFIAKNPKFFEEDIKQTIFPINPQQLRSINGYRTALYLKKNYVDQYKNYRVTLKAIKLWAKNKGIYSQIFGYLGGAAFSIMLAKICQLYPNYSTLLLLDRFFFIYANWAWSIPVIIQKTKSSQRPLEEQYNSPPERQMENYERPMENYQSQMVILTPLQPHMNAGYHVSKIMSKITKKQFRLASKLIAEINRKKKNWQDLFVPFDFFNEYKNFIQISIMGEKLDDFVPWKGNIQSKIRKFIQYLQQYFQFHHGIEVNLYPKSFPSKHPNFKHCSRYYIGIKCNSSSTINDYLQIDLTQSVRGFLELLQSYPEIDKAPKQINIGFTHLPRKSISDDILEAFSKGFPQNDQ